MSAIHLCMMKLEGDWQIIPEILLFISAPDKKGIIENPAVHTSSSVKFCIYDSERADDHTIFGQVPVLTACGNLRRILQILLIEKLPLDWALSSKVHRLRLL